MNKLKFYLFPLVIAALFVVSTAFATVSSTTNLKRVNGDGGTLAFTFSFKVLENDDLKVYTVVDATNVATLKGEGADYSISYNADHEGGTVTFLVAPAATVDVLLVADPTLTQSTDFPSEGSLDEASLEAALDRSILVDTAQEEAINRSLKLKQSDAENTTNYGGLYIDLDTDRGGKVLQWSADGTSVEAGADASDLSDLTASAAAAAASEAAAASSASAASSSASASSASATASATSAASFKSTSTSAVAVGTGTKTFTTQSGKLYAVGDQVLAASAADGTKYIHGDVTSYSGTTLVVNSTDSGAAGTPSDWNISISGTRGTTGATGATGATGQSGAGTGDMLAAQNLNDVANKSTSRTNLGVAIGTDVEAYDAFLLSIATLGTAADKMLYTTGVNTAAEASLTAAGRALLDDADNTAQRATLGTSTVSNGGTGATTLGDAGVLVGNGTGAVQVTSAGTSGQVLTSNGAGVDPTFQSGGVSGGLTVIASGNLATGSPTVVDITSIPATYRALRLYISGASNSVATRALTVEVDTGLGLGNSENGATYKQISVAAISNTAGNISLWNATTQTAAQTSSCLIEFPAYQSGPAKGYSGIFATGTASSLEWASGAQTTNGLLTGSTGGVARTGAITGIRITWDNVSSGVFDAGTYALYGVN